MRDEMVKALDPMAVFFIWNAAIRHWELPARLAINPHVSMSQRVHDVGEWFAQFERNLEKLAGDTMKKADSSKPFEFRGFVNVRLSDQDKQAIGAIDQPLGDLMETLGALILSGYKLSISYDRYSSAVQISLTCTDPQSGNYGYAISARHPDLALALVTLVYKHFDLLGMDWSNAHNEMVDRSWD